MEERQELNDRRGSDRQLIRTLERPWVEDDGRRMASGNLAVLGPGNLTALEKTILSAILGRNGR